MPIVALVVAGVLAIATLLTALGAFFTIDQSERGVLLRNGAYVTTVEPGLHFKTPWIESVASVSVQTHTRSYDKVNSYSADQQPADIKLSVTYHIDPSRVSDVYARFGGSLDMMAGRLLDPRVQQEFKVVFGRYTAVSAIQDRAKLNTDAFSTIQKALAGDPEVVLEGVQVENIDFSGQYVQSIEARMQAEIEVQRIKQQEQQQEVQAQITVIQAKAQADARLAQARAEAEATRIQGEAQAAAVKAQSDVIAANPAYTGYLAATRWNGALPQTMVPGASVPFLGVK